MGQRFSIYLFREVKLLFISHNIVPTVVFALSHIFENPIYALIISEIVPVKNHHLAEV